MPFKNLQKRKEYVDKYNREHVITKEKRAWYYLERKKNMGKKSVELDESKRNREDPKATIFAGENTEGDIL